LADLVCFQCGLKVITWRGEHGYKHASGGRNPKQHKHRQHKPIPCPREEYERAFAIDTPIEEARAIIAKYRSK